MLPLLDLGISYASLMTTQIVEHCNKLILTVDSMPITIERAQIIEDCLADYGFSIGGKKPLFFVSINRYRQENALSLEQIENILNSSSLPLIPPDSAQAARVQRENKPFMLLQPTSVVCLQYMAVAQKLAQLGWIRI